MTPAAPWPPQAFCFSLAVASPTLSPLVCHQPATTCVYSPTHSPEAVKKRVGSGKASSHLDLLETWDQYKLQSLSEQDSLVDRRVASDGVQALQRPPSLAADWTLSWTRPYSSDIPSRGCRPPRSYLLWTLPRLEVGGTVETAHRVETQDHRHPEGDAMMTTRTDAVGERTARRLTEEQRAASNACRLPGPYLLW
ncbi:hypothetical protein KC328_g5193 [Hortaea werneckii]|nr:hypothetical protein KC328_g5193 [Hortaea werneckii]